MFYVRMEAGRAVEVATDYPTTGETRGEYKLPVYDDRFENRNDWKSFERVTEIAAQLTEATGVTYLPTDSGPNVSPRYDVIAAPVVGAEVSKAFNGDYYPEGVIVSISKTFKRVETSTGAVFFRRKNSGAWIENGTWCMVEGHVSRMNPSF